ncbi:MAG: PEP/pyruvate-binding domain-containing protein, partial [Planctomycetaceae bacterium]
MTVPRWIYALEDPLPPDISAVSLLGGKGHSLRRLAAAQLIVPRGFTITTAACREALRSDSHWP